MSLHSSISAIFAKATLFTAVAIGFMALHASAQTSGGAEAITPLPSSLTLTSVKARAQEVAADEALASSVKDATLASLKTAQDNIQLGFDKRAQYIALTEFSKTAPNTLLEVEAKISEVLAQLDTPIIEDTAPVTDDRLFVMEQELRSFSAEAKNLRELIKALDVSDETLSLRMQEARSQSLTAANVLVQIQTQMQVQIKARSGAAKTVKGDASWTTLLARRFAREWELEMLGAEILNIPHQERLLGPRRELAALKLQQLNRQIEYLRLKTGEQRVAEARSRLAETQAFVAQVATLHPMVVEYAKQNVELAQQISSIALAGGNSLLVEARVNSELKRLSEDSSLAKQILAEGNVNRKYGAVLRRLRANIPNDTAIKNDIAARSQTKLDISMQRILAQDKLKEYPVASRDIAELFEAWSSSDREAQPLLEPDAAALRTALSTRRALLQEIAINASRKVEKLVQLNTGQQALRVEIRALKALLDQQLIWLPSTQPISASWPKQIVEGVARTLRPSNFTTAITDFLTSVNWHLFSTLIVLTLLALTVRLRPRFMAFVGAMSKTVGRVREDTLWNTPAAVVAGVLRGAPLFIGLVWIGLLLSDKRGASFSVNLGESIMLVSGIWAALLVLRFWSGDSQLLDLHFNVKKPLRDRVRANMVWFGTAQSVAVVIMTLCDETDMGGLGLLGFLIGTAAFGVLAYRLLWQEHDQGTQFLRQDGFVARHKNKIFGLSLAIPVITSSLALSGYFVTALEVQTRIIITCGLILAAYITYGVAQRTVVVSQRRLALETALSRRAKAVKARETREAALESGLPPVPTVNYDEIDLESISRQSTQLLNVIGVLIFSALTWFLWADLMPALSIFDQVKLPFDTSYLDTDNVRQSEPATLWDLIQAIFVGVLVFLAAKNLPGFLDLFVLKRSGIAAGTRYAITTVLGYIIVIIGIILVGDRLGIEWGNLQWIIAALGVGIGFGLQEIIANFISGLIILFERPVRLGDYVTIGDQSGTVNRIQIRAITLADLDHREILIPNKELITGRVTNWTLSNSTLRMIVKVGIAYGSDTDAAQNLMLKTVKKIKSVLSTPEPQVLFLGFGDSALDFEIRVFLPSVSARFPVAHEIHTQVNKALEAAGISIPFPQRDVHVVSALPAQELMSKTKPSKAKAAK